MWTMGDDFSINSLASLNFIRVSTFKDSKLNYL